MKMLIAVLGLIGMSATAHAAYTTGDKIIFQKDSAYVSAVFSKSLCLNGDVYEATITKCAVWNSEKGDKNCVKTVSYKGFQPMNSTALRCAERVEKGETCTKWVSYDLVQKPVRVVNFFNNDHELIKTVTVTIPACAE